MFPANSCINEYFVFSEAHHYIYQPMTDSLESFLEIYEQEYHSYIPEISFVLTEKPVQDSILELKIDFYFRDSSVITEYTHPIIFQ